MMRLLVDNEGCDIYTTLVRYNRLGVALVKQLFQGRLRRNLATRKTINHTSN